MFCEQRQSGSILCQHIRERKGETVADIMTQWASERSCSVGRASAPGTRYTVQHPAWISKSSLPLTLRLIFKSWLQSIHTHADMSTFAHTHTIHHVPCGQWRTEVFLINWLFCSDSCIYKYCIKEKLIICYNICGWMTYGYKADVLEKWITSVCICPLLYHTYIKEKDDW